MFRFDKLTQKAQEALQQAQAIAEKNESQVMFPLHLLIALAEEKEGIVRPVLEKCGVQPDAIVAEARRLLANLPKTAGVPARHVPLASPSTRCWSAPSTKPPASRTSSSPPSTCCSPSPSSAATPPASCSTAPAPPTTPSSRPWSPSAATQRVTDQNPETKYQALERYAHDLTESARQGKLDPVIGRDDEIRRVMQVLSRRTKNNPVLIGEPGVGKTAIVEGLAQRIVRGDVPDQLKNKKLVAIDLGSMIAGTKFRGEFEDRLKAVVKEIIDSNGEIICFIDELHTLVGAGSAEGAIDAANLLKPALARGELRCIGATTLNEYKKHVEKDAALARRFRTVMVGEPSVDDTIAILRGLKEKFEIHHGVRIKDSAIIAAAVLSHRYIADRFLPDKAIDLIDEAGSALRLQIGSMPIEIDDLDRRISHLEIERQALSKEKDARLARAPAPRRKRAGAPARRSRRPRRSAGTAKRAPSPASASSRRSRTPCARKRRRPAAPAIGKRPPSCATAASRRSKRTSRPPSRSWKPSRKTPCSKRRSAKTISPASWPSGPASRSPA